MELTWSVFIGCELRIQCIKRREDKETLLHQGLHLIINSKNVYMTSDTGIPLTYILL